MLRKSRVMHSKVGAFFCLKLSKQIKWNILFIYTLRSRIVRVFLHMYLDGLILRLTSVEYLLACELYSKKMSWGLDERVVPFLWGLDDSSTCFPLSVLLGPLMDEALRNFWSEYFQELVPGSRIGMTDNEVFVKLIWWLRVVWGWRWRLCVWK